MWKLINQPSTTYSTLRVLLPFMGLKGPLRSACRLFAVPSPWICPAGAGSDEITTPRLMAAENETLWMPFLPWLMNMCAPHDCQTTRRLTVKPDHSSSLVFHLATRLAIRGLPRNRLRPRPDAVARASSYLFSVARALDIGSHDDHGLTARRLGTAAFSGREILGDPVRW